MVVAIMYNYMVGHIQSTEDEVTKKKTEEGGSVAGNECGNKLRRMTECE